ncbi:MAG TPA: NrdJb [Pseudomonas xinjiangensis]|uniref:ribonucleoside-diphosphate reductase n=2 Tax=root TaxID=1 RepID=A0A7V1FQS6_9GAMM|nr:NrdJb [Halopseudomonas xinjiangensis]HEC47086.1 NrdJb [Halopseudomonas xinjiangensis]
MALKITSKIVDYAVVKPNEPAPAIAAAPVETIEEMHEKLKRPEFLEGSTYKIKTPTSEHAIYVTINDVILNHGSDHEIRRPFEIFINSKNMEHYQWISALTLIISAVFRKGGDCTFLVEELRSVFDPKGGYMKRGGRWMPSLVAEIGDVLDQHLKRIGMISDEMDEHQRAYLEQKRAEFVSLKPQSQTSADCDDSTESYPPGAQMCGKCHTQAAVLMDGCMTCLSCGDSKCG